jgi:hypothetical protein
MPSNSSSRKLFHIQTYLFAQLQGCCVGGFWIWEPMRGYLDALVIISRLRADECDKGGK